MKKVERPVIDESALGINPFVSNLKIPINKITLPGQYKKEEDLLVPAEVEMEKEPSARVYIDAKRRKHMVSLHPRAKALLLWLIYESEGNKDYIWVNYRRYMEEDEVKNYKTYKAAVDELMAKGFVQSTIMQHVYWINPYFFFNGSRVNRFPQNVVKK